MIYLLIGACLVQEKNTPASTEISQVIILKDGQTATSVYNDETLRCEATVYNPDRTVEPSYLWLNGTEELSNAQDLTLTSSMALPGDEITCLVSDGGDEDSEAGTAVLPVDNRLPSAPTSVVITPEEPIAEVDDLTCTAEGSADPDGETVSYSYVWTSVGGIEADGQSLAADFAALDTAWTCEATPIDSTGTGESNVAMVELQPNVTCNIEPCDAALSLLQQQLDFVRISAGADPLGRYTLTQDYLLQNTEVTIGQFEEVTGFHPTEGVDLVEKSYDPNHPSFTELNYPASFVTWSMAAYFANQLTMIDNNQNGEQLSACYDCTGSGVGVSCELVEDPYDCSGYRLPTQAEWEYAARSGSTSDIWTEAGGGQIVPTTEIDINCSNALISDGLDTPLSDYAWFCAEATESDNRTYHTEVASKIPNGFGLYDMHGNGAEWSLDAVQTLTSVNELSGENPHYLSSSSIYFLLLGGTDSQQPFQLTADSLIKFEDGEDRWNFFGFRVMRTLVE